MSAVPPVYVRAHPKSSKARNDPVYHNAQCPKLTQRNLKPTDYVPVPQPPRGYRACKRCGG